MLPQTFWMRKRVTHWDSKVDGILLESVALIDFFKGKKPEKPLLRFLWHGTLALISLVISFPDQNLR